MWGRPLILSTLKSPWGSNPVVTCLREGNNTSRNMRIITPENTSWTSEGVVFRRLDMRWIIKTLAQHDGKNIWCVHYGRENGAGAGQTVENVAYQGNIERQQQQTPRQTSYPPIPEDVFAVVAPWLSHPRTWPHPIESTTFPRIDSFYF